MDRLNHNFQYSIVPICNKHTMLCLQTETCYVSLSFQQSTQTWLFDTRYGIHSSKHNCSFSTCTMQSIKRNENILPTSFSQPCNKLYLLIAKCLGHSISIQRQEINLVLLLLLMSLWTEPFLRPCLSFLETRLLSQQL